MLKLVHTHMLKLVTHNTEVHTHTQVHTSTYSHTYTPTYQCTDYTHTSRHFIHQNAAVVLYVHTRSYTI